MKKRSIIILCLLTITFISSIITPIILFNSFKKNYYNKDDIAEYIIEIQQLINSEKEELNKEINLVKATYNAELNKLKEELNLNKQAINNLTTAYNIKISELENIDNKIKEDITLLKTSYDNEIKYLKEKDTSLQNSINTLTSTYNNKINELINTYDSKILELNNKITSIINSISVNSDKIDSIEDKINSIYNNPETLFSIFKEYYPDYQGTEKDWITDISRNNICNLFGHEFDEGVITIYPNVGVEGKKVYTCSICNEERIEILDAIISVDLEVYEVNGYKYINYGSYPQTHINDEELIILLNNLTETNNRGYYEYNGNEYAKIVSNPYRIGSYTDKYGNTQYYKYSSGKTVEYGVTEWFKVEPIKWRILSIVNNNYQVLSEYILTAQKYYKDSYYRQIDGVDIAPNNYKYSDIRSFLNKEFINSAFTIEQQNILITTEVDNSVSTVDKFVCENTFDKIYLLSYKDIRNSDFGFVDSNSRQAKVTDYAKATGAYWYTDAECLDCASWWLRSSTYNAYFYEDSVDYDGSVYYGHVDYPYYGVRPATAIAVN